VYQWPWFPLQCILSPVLYVSMKQNLNF